MRNVWWIVGALVVIVAPTVGTSIYLARNAPPKKQSGTALVDAATPIATVTSVASDEENSPEDSVEEGSGDSSDESEPVGRPISRPPAIPPNLDLAESTTDSDYDTANPPRPGLEGKSRALRRREGSHLVNVVGEVVKRGTEFEFQPSDNSGSLILLENLVLERMEHYEAAKNREGKRLVWKLTGQVTEYRGQNFLLATSVHIYSNPGDINDSQVPK